VKTSKIEDPKQIGSRLLARGSGAVVLKLGSKGAMLIGRDGEIERFKPIKVKVVDTTAAGDAFTGALAVAHAEGLDLAAAVRLQTPPALSAVRASALSPHCRTGLLWKSFSRF